MRVTQAVYIGKIVTPVAPAPGYGRCRRRIASGVPVRDLYQVCGVHIHRTVSSVRPTLPEFGIVLSRIITRVIETRIGTGYIHLHGTRDRVFCGGIDSCCKVPAEVVREYVPLLAVRAPRQSPVIGLGIRAIVTERKTRIIYACLVRLDYIFQIRCRSHRVFYTRIGHAVIVIKEPRVTRLRERLHVVGILLDQDS